MLSRISWTIIFTLLFAGIATWGWLKISGNQLMPIKAVQISGNCSRIDQQLVHQTIRSFLNENNFLTLNTEELKEQLLQIPWIASASVSRTWPAKLQIHLAEYDVVARWNGSTFLSSHGEMVGVKNFSPLQDIPLLSGPDGQQQFMWQQYQAMKEILAPLGLKITHLAFSMRHAWRVKLENGLVLVLGRTDTLGRLQRIVSMYSQIIGSRSDEVAYIDLRYANAIAVRWKDKEINV